MSLADASSATPVYKLTDLSGRAVCHVRTTINFLPAPLCWQVRLLLHATRTLRRQESQFCLAMFMTPKSICASHISPFIAGISCDIATL